MDSPSEGRNGAAGQHHSAPALASRRQGQVLLCSGCSCRLARQPLSNFLVAGEKASSSGLCAEVQR